MFLVLFRWLDNWLYQQNRIANNDNSQKVTPEYLIEDYQKILY